MLKFKVQFFMKVCEGVKKKQLNHVQINVKLLKEGWVPSNLSFHPVREAEPGF